MNRVKIDFQINYRPMIFLPVVFLLIIMSPSWAEVFFVEKETDVNNGIVKKSAKVIIGEQSKTRDLYIVNGQAEKPAKFIWIFHGYKPAGDPYDQSPKNFIVRWGIPAICSRNNYVCVSVDMGTSLYPVYDFSNQSHISDLRFLQEIYNELIFNKFKNAPVVIIGVSTGVEGSIKFVSVIDNLTVESLVALSGTYDLASPSLSVESGEYRIHERSFSDNSSWLLSENPVTILTRKAPRMNLYLFCEEYSIYRTQTNELLEKNISTINIENNLFLGNGFSHNWKFWGSRSVILKLKEIIEK